MDRETVITHLQIIHTWAEFARKRDLQFFTPRHLEDIAQWSDDAIAMLKEQEATIKAQQFVLNNSCEKLKEQKMAMKPKNIDKVGGNCPVCGLRMARNHKYCYQCRQEMNWE